MSRRLLLLSNSRNPESGFLEHADQAIRDHLKNTKEILFIPFAGVTISWDDYTELVRSRFADFGISVTSLHEVGNPVDSIGAATAIAVGGGNTWQLLNELQRLNVPDTIRECVLSGVPYLGWSAGSNIACPTIRTTNDMPIVEPHSFRALNLISFQLNPHYTDRSIPGHGGETRPQRIEEYLTVNREETVLGLPEGTWLRVEGDEYTIDGGSAILFRSGKKPEEISEGSLLLK